MFRYIIPGTPNFTVESFANTRFGSFRKRPDHEKKFVDAIKQFVTNSASNETTGESPPTTTNTNTSTSDQWLN
jgi:hypothetical protein